MLQKNYIYWKRQKYIYHLYQTQQLERKYNAEMLMD